MKVNHLRCQSINSTDAIFVRERQISEMKGKEGEWDRGKGRKAETQTETEKKQEMTRNSLFLFLFCLPRHFCLEKFLIFFGREMMTKKTREKNDELLKSGERCSYSKSSLACLYLFPLTACLCIEWLFHQVETQREKSLEPFLFRSFCERWGKGTPNTQQPQGVR